MEGSRRMEKQTELLKQKDEWRKYTKGLNGMRGESQRG